MTNYEEVVNYEVGHTSDQACVQSVQYAVPVLFYHDISDVREVKSMGIMSEDTAGALIRKAFDAVDPNGFIQFTFQGGEPTLAGLVFFRTFMMLAFTPSTINP